MTSPKLNYLIIAGSLLMYFSVYIQLLYSTKERGNHVHCTVRTALQLPSIITCLSPCKHRDENPSMQLHTWMYVLGYLLAFGTILAKMWRVYQIFHNPAPNKMVTEHLCGIRVLYRLVVDANRLDKSLLSWTYKYCAQDI